MLALQNMSATNHTALVIPSETPPTALQLKEALITYDQVIVIDPADREMMPPQLIMSAMARGREVGFFYSGMAARPIGKLPKYDENFAKTLEEFKIALEQRILRVASTFQYLPLPGMPPPPPTDLIEPGYALNHAFVLALYRALAGKQDLLRLAIEGDSLLALEAPVLASASASGMADGSINGTPFSPLLEGVAPDRQEALTEIARGRLGTIVKAAGYCQVKGFVPIFGALGYCRVLEKIAADLRQQLSTLDPDPFWSRRARILDIAHNELIETEVLKSMSVEEILKLRTSAWGRERIARDALFDAVLSLAQEIEDDARFEEEVRMRIRAYEEAARDLWNERYDLRRGLAADVVKGISAVGAGYLGSTAVIQWPVSGALAALAVVGWAAHLIKDYSGTIARLRTEERRLQRTSLLGLHNFFRGLGELSREP
jgi:hypothetical protein